MASSPIAGIFALDPFSTANPTPAQSAAIAQACGDLGGSGFGHVLFASFHVSVAGDISFNNTTVISGGTLTGQLDANLPALIAAMKTSGQVQKVFISFGGGGCFRGQAIGYWDFKYIQDLIAAFPSPANNPFFKNLAILMRTFHIDGIDFDLEVYTSGGLCPGGFAATYQSFQRTLLDVTAWCVTNGYLVTASPYDEASFWADLLAAAYSENGNVQPFSGFNLQNAVGNSVQADYFIAAIEGVTAGISNAPGFLSAGLQIGTGDAPSDVQEIFGIYPGNGNGIGGGWLWNMNAFPPANAGQYATAILDAIS